MNGAYEKGSEGKKTERDTHLELYFDSVFVWHVVEMFPTSA